MDHLPECDEHHIVVPFVATPRVYKPEEFFTLPRTLQHSLTELMQSGPRILKEEDTPSFLQSWLFFSLLAQVLNQDIDSRDFLRSSHGKLELITTDLQKLFNQTALRRTSRTLVQAEESDRHEGVHASLALDDARNFVLKWLSDNDQERDFTQSAGKAHGNWSEFGDSVFRSQFPELCLSFGILGETLDRYRTRFCVPLPNDASDRHDSWEDKAGDQRGWGFSDLLRLRMQRIGWWSVISLCVWAPLTCYSPHEIRRINMTAGDLSSIYFISSFPPTQQADHSKCNLEQCMLGSYTASAKHTPHCVYREGNTAGLMPDQQELIRITLAGNIPLLKYTNREELILLEYVMPKKDEGPIDDGERNQTRFVAISHAWSDGLSPSEGKGLPRCQLLRLRDTMSRSPDTKDLPFWIDSLCVPSPIKVKNKAIQDMGQVYQHAFTVLVLDSNLRSTSRIPNTLEATVRINTGIWSRRMWTLPEGVVARNLHFDFKDGLLSATELRSRYERAKRDPLDREHHAYKAGWLFSPYMFSIRHRLDGAPASEGKGRVGYQRVALVFQAMQWREATRLEDETLCLARLLDLDPLPLLNITKPTDSSIQSQRMVEFLTLLDQVGIPSGMIFLPGPKLDLKGLAWAPTSWMGKHSRVLSDPLFVKEQRFSFLTRNGLHVQYPGILLHPGRRHLQEKFWIPTSRNLTNWYRIEYIPGSSSARSWEKTWKLASSGSLFPAIIRSRFDRSNEPELALLVKVVACREDIQSSSNVPGRQQPDTIRWAQSLCRVWLCWESDNAVAARLTEEFRYNIREMTRADLLDSDQRWVVDGYCWEKESNQANGQTNGARNDHE